MSYHFSRAGQILTSAAVALVCARALFPAGCENSPVLFAYQGSVFTVSPGGRPTQVASGLGQPYDLRWDRDCRRFAFIDRGQFWLAEVGRTARKVAFPGTVDSYDWSPDGNRVAVSAQTPACGGSPLPSNMIKPSVSDVWVVSFPELTAKAVSHDCATSVLGWSPDGKELALKRKAVPTPPCAAGTPPGLAVAPPCATADVLVWDAEVGWIKPIVTADQLNREHLEADTLAAWSPATDALYLWSMVGWDGAGYLFAVDASSGKFLWRFPCDDAVDLGSGLIGTDRRVWVEKTESMEWQSAILDDRGSVVRNSPTAPQGRDWSAPAGLQPRFEGGRMEFTTDSGSVIWRYDLPEHYEWSQAEWTPAGGVAVVGWKGNLYPRQLVMGVWLLDPRRKAGARLFEGTVPEANETVSLAVLASGGAALAGGGYSARIIPPLVLGKWSHAAPLTGSGMAPAAAEAPGHDAMASGVGRR